MLLLSQKAYIERILENFRTNKYSTGITPIQKGDKFRNIQCPKNDVERQVKEPILYTSIVGNSMYLQKCTRPDISLVARMLGRYQSDLGMDHCKAAKKVARHLQGTRDYALLHKKSNTSRTNRILESRF